LGIEYVQQMLQMGTAHYLLEDIGWTTEEECFTYEHDFKLVEELKPGSFRSKANP